MKSFHDTCSVDNKVLVPLLQIACSAKHFVYSHLQTFSTACRICLIQFLYDARCKLFISFVYREKISVLWIQRVVPRCCEYVACFHKKIHPQTLQIFLIQYRLLFCSHFKDSFIVVFMHQIWRMANFVQNYCSISALFPDDF